jgi:hypothetical protein
MGRSTVCLRLSLTLSLSLAHCVYISTVLLACEGIEGGLGRRYSLAPVYTDMRSYLGEMYTVFREMSDINNLGCGGDDDHITGTLEVRKSSSNDVPGWGIAVIVIVVLLVLALCGLVCCMVAKERAGSPMFSKMMPDSV